MEAKASIGTPSLNAIDVAGLVSHARGKDVAAAGVMLVAPKYPGADDPGSEINLRAVEQRVSCWTAEDLARVVENAERRHVTAQEVQRVVMNNFTILDVATAVEALVSQPTYSRSEIYVGILDALDALSKRLRDAPRTIDMVAAEVTRAPELDAVDMAEIADAALDLARASRGLIHVTEAGEIILLGDLAEVRRRTAGLTHADATPRRLGSFRDRGQS